MYSNVLVATATGGDLYTERGAKESEERGDMSFTLGGWWWYTSKVCEVERYRQWQRAFKYIVSVDVSEQVSKIGIVLHSQQSATRRGCKNGPLFPTHRHSESLSVVLME